MRKNQLYIKVNNDWKELDLFEDADIPTTFEIDTLKLGERATGYSIDFQLPATNNNTLIFGLVNDINNYRGSFEIDKEYDAILTDNSLTIFQGQFRLKKITIKHNRETIYTGNLYGGVKNLLDALGNDTLIGNEDPSKDLDFSEYAVDRTDMQLSNFRDYLQTKYTDGTGFGLTLLDKFNKYSQSFSAGAQTWYTDETTPYLYDIEIFNKIIHQAGWRYESEFLSGTDFSNYLHDARWNDTIGQFDVNSLIYPSMSVKISQQNPSVYSTITELDAASETIAAHFQISSSWPFDDYETVTYDNTYFDPLKYSLTQSGSDSLTSYSFTATESNIYDVNINFPFNFEIQLWNTSAERYLLTSETVHTYSRPYKLMIQTVKNDRTFLGTPTVIEGNYADSYTSENDSGKITLGSGTFSYTDRLSLSRGDKIGLYVWVIVPIRHTYWDSETETYKYYGCFFTDEILSKLCVPVDANVHITPNNQSDIVSIQSLQGFYEDASFDPTRILNQKTTKREFINNFVKSFNLYIEDVSGKMNYKTGKLYPDNTLRIEPWEIFYNPEVNYSTNVHDWTDKVDWETVEYSRVSDLLYTNQHFNKAQDDDFFNEDYNKTFKVKHEDRVVHSLYPSKDVNEIDVNVSANLCGVVNNQTDTIQCPKVFSLDKDDNIDEKKEFSDGMFFIWRNKTHQETQLSTNYTVKLQSRLSSSSLNIVDYYTADYLNKGYGADTATLSFGPIENYYQNLKGSQMTSNDLYNAFYKKQFEAMVQQDARILEANIYLTPFDIATLQMSDKIIVGDNYWRILSIDQWTSEDNPCRVKLLKVFE